MLKLMSALFPIYRSRRCLLDTAMWCTAARARCCPAFGLSAGRHRCLLPDSRYRQNSHYSSSTASWWAACPPSRTCPSCPASCRSSATRTQSTKSSTKKSSTTRATIWPSKAKTWTERARYCSWSHPPPPCLTWDNEQHVFLSASVSPSAGIWHWSDDRNSTMQRDVSFAQPADAPASRFSADSLGPETGRRSRNGGRRRPTAALRNWQAELCRVERRSRSAFGISHHRYHYW